MHFNEHYANSGIVLLYNSLHHWVQYALAMLLAY